MGKRRKRNETAPDLLGKMIKEIGRKKRNDLDLGQDPEKRVKKIKRRTRNVHLDPKPLAQDQNLRSERVKKKKKREREKKKREKLRRRRENAKKKKEKENKGNVKKK